MSQMVVNGNSWSTYLCHIFLISQWLYPKKICEERPWPERGWPSLCSAGVCVCGFTQGAAASCVGKRLDYDSLVREIVHFLSLR